MQTRTTVLVWIATVTTTLAAGQLAPQNESIRQEDLSADLSFLASDEMRGRLTDTPENRLAAAFISARFQRLGLRPAGPSGSFFQPYHLMKATLGPDNLLVVVQGENSELRLRAGQDFYPLRFSASGRARGALVVAGFGIVAPELDYDDYRGDDVRGRIVLVFDHEPGERDPASPFDGVVSAEAASPLRKALFAQSNGAIGILFVSDVHNHPGPENFEGAASSYWPARAPRIERYTLATWAGRVRIPAAQVSVGLAEILVRGTGRSLADLARAADTTQGLMPIAISGPPIDLTVSVDRRVIADQNVVASLEGSDPRLKDESILICAHYDHNGADGEQIFNGADDDGSGTVGLLEIAEAYALAARAGQRPRRSILFAAWNSEERGLLGAWAYTEQPLVPLEKTVAVLNMDMIGRNEEVPEGGGSRFRGLDIQTAESNRNAVNIVGSTRSADLKAAVEKANAAIGLELKYRYDNHISNLVRRSDHWPFMQRQVPALWFHTGLHPDYHTIYDDPEKINYAKMERVVRLVHLVSWSLAQQDARPRLSTKR